MPLGRHEPEVLSVGVEADAVDAPRAAPRHGDHLQRRPLQRQHVDPVPIGHVEQRLRRPTLARASTPDGNADRLAERHTAVAAVAPNLPQVPRAAAGRSALVHQDRVPPAVANVDEGLARGDAQRCTTRELAPPKGPEAPAEARGGRGRAGARRDAGRVRLEPVREEQEQRGRVQPPVVLSARPSAAQCDAEHSLPRPICARQRDTLPETAALPE
mmetsp:Transcript_9849/g.31219  ORF Transcript_9849/g.31219 Transcript_9849/m.31219 type:complete len:215 (-) Transcript_9849:484-1128(-)